MAETKTNEAPKLEATTTPAQDVNISGEQEPELNEADGEPIFHAPDEEGDDDNE